TRSSVGTGRAAAGPERAIEGSRPALRSPRPSEGPGRLPVGGLGLGPRLLGERGEVLDEVVCAQDAAPVAELDDRQPAQREGERPEPLERQSEEGEQDELEDAGVADEEGPRGVGGGGPGITGDGRPAAR